MGFWNDVTNYFSPPSGATTRPDGNKEVVTPLIDPTGAVSLAYTVEDKKGRVLPRETAKAQQQFNQAQADAPNVSARGFANFGTSSISGFVTGIPSIPSMVSGWFHHKGVFGGWHSHPFTADDIAGATDGLVLDSFKEGSVGDHISQRIKQEKAQTKSLEKNPAYAAGEWGYIGLTAAQGVAGAYAIATRIPSLVRSIPSLIDSAKSFRVGSFLKGADEAAPDLAAEPGVAGTTQRWNDGTKQWEPVQQPSASTQPSANTASSPKPGQTTAAKPATAQPNQATPAQPAAKWDPKAKKFVVEPHITDTEFDSATNSYKPAGSAGTPENEAAGSAKPTANAGPPPKPSADASSEGHDPSSGSTASNPAGSKTAPGSNSPASAEQPRKTVADWLKEHPGEPAKPGTQGSVPNAGSRSAPITSPPRGGSVPDAGYPTVRPNAARPVAEKSPVTPVGRNAFAEQHPLATHPGSPGVVLEREVLPTNAAGTSAVARSSEVAPAEVTPAAAKPATVPAETRTPAMPKSGEDHAVSTGPKDSRLTPTDRISVPKVPHAEPAKASPAEAQTGTALAPNSKSTAIVPRESGAPESKLPATQGSRAVSEVKPSSSVPKTVKGNNIRIPLPVAGRRNAAMRNGLFDLDKSHLSKEDTEAAAVTAKAIEADRLTEVTFIGHTDTSGSVEHNMRLSKARARNFGAEVAKDLKNDGYKDVKINTIGVGEADQAIKTGNGVQNAENRRVTAVAGPPPNREKSSDTAPPQQGGSMRKGNATAFSHRATPHYTFNSP